MTAHLVAAMQALDAAAALVGQARSERAHFAAEAVVGWEGPARRAFDGEIAALAAEAAALLVAIGAAQEALDEMVRANVTGGSS